MLPSTEQTNEAAMPTSPTMLLEGKKRSLLQTVVGATLAPTLECENCPVTDTRVHVNDTSQYPWNAAGLLSKHGEIQEQGAATE